MELGVGIRDERRKPFQIIGNRQTTSMEAEIARADNGNMIIGVIRTGTSLEGFPKIHLGPKLALLQLT